jgi:hypothetical protein
MIEHNKSLETPENGDYLRIKLPVYSQKDLEEVLSKIPLQISRHEIEDTKKYTYPTYLCYSTKENYMFISKNINNYTEINSINFFSIIRSNTSCSTKETPVNTPSPCIKILNGYRYIDLPVKKLENNKYYIYIGDNPGEHWNREMRFMLDKLPRMFTSYGDRDVNLLFKGSFGGGSTWNWETGLENFREVITEKDTPIREVSSTTYTISGKTLTTGEATTTPKKETGKLSIEDRQSRRNRILSKLSCK